jgi:hypothetical protein
MAWGRRCDIGCESWPDEPIYQKCPTCGEPTTRFSNLTPVSAEEGRSAIRAAAFERFYEHHCREKGQPIEGDLPYDADIEARYPRVRVSPPAPARPRSGGGVAKKAAASG